jgi:predicted metal-dependent HD superfamily phosphohydrolase
LPRSGVLPKELAAISMIETLRQQWLTELHDLADEATLVAVFERLCKAYQEKKRTYHNLHHIAALLLLAQKYRTDLQDFTSVFLAIWFHDAVYKPHRKDNEEASAALARKELQCWQLSDEVINKVVHYILATKYHWAVDDNDLQWLLDFDLAVLSSPWQEYETYTQQIRQEYSLYPDFIYNAGRKKAMSAFLERPAIYGKLGDRAEQQARLNITLEISRL